MKETISSLLMCHCHLLSAVVEIDKSVVMKWRER